MARTYSEAEAQKVFARVAERQRTAGPAAAGLSLADLEEAARAAGLDPTLVAAAAAEIDTPAPNRGLFGAPVETVRHRVVRGRVSDDAWEAIVGAARAEFGRTGTAGQVGRTREWTVATGTGNAQAVTRVALEPLGADTRIVVTRSSRDVALGFTIGGSVMGAMSILFATLFAFGVDPEMWVPAVLLAAMSAVFLGGTQIGLRVWHARQTVRVDALLDRLDLVARDAAPPASDAESAGEGFAPSGRMDASLFEPADDAGTPPESLPHSADLPRRTRA